MCNSTDCSATQEVLLQYIQATNYYTSVHTAYNFQTGRSTQWVPKGIQAQFMKIHKGLHIVCS